MSFRHLFLRRRQKVWLYKGNFWQIQEKIPQFRFPFVTQTYKKNRALFLVPHFQGRSHKNYMSCYREKILGKSVGYGENAEKVK